MDTLQAFALSEANREKESMVFDWDEAAKIIKKLGAKNASAGLSGDWEYTGGEILENGKIPKDSYTYLASTWAVPELEIDGEIFECYKMKSATAGWNEETFWPESAKAILGL